MASLACRTCQSLKTAPGRLRALSTAAAGTSIAVETWSDATQPIESACTPPSSWYTGAAALHAEATRVFRRRWQAVGHVGQVVSPGDYFTGSYPGTHDYVVCRDDAGVLRAFHNVCRHHAAPVAAGSGAALQFTCGYHGWTYRLDGRLLRAPRLRGIANFRAADHGLVPLDVDTWGPFVFVRAPSPTGEPRVADWLGAGGAAALAAGLQDGGLVPVAQREFTLACNWKVFVDNYLDGGYHVSVAHPDLAAGLDLGSYRSEVYRWVSIQRCAARPTASRLAGQREACYCYVYPNFMANRYGPWLDTNTVLPLGQDKCKVLYRWYLDAALAKDAALVQAGLADSEAVQAEDTALCEAVQRGLASPAYGAGRYAPAVERPMWEFHQRLCEDLAAAPTEGLQQQDVLA